ncbi:hypothetical protein QVD17_30165 [Tagetes erecta]|uniref:Uncharacterized protein n=1 Tax=Tagetes erecta TaxID=13708 RepID=A0AAD8NN07_TARER|nr:hypothetical protein QVD17_30165 [Tagetes erecta]
MGNRILSYITNNTRNATSMIYASKAKLGSQPAPRVASFSSKGPDALTPEILKVIDYLTFDNFKRYYKCIFAAVLAALNYYVGIFLIELSVLIIFLLD